MKPLHYNTLILAGVLFAGPVTSVSAEETVALNTRVNQTMETLIEKKMHDVLRRDIAASAARMTERQESRKPAHAEFVDLDLRDCDCVSANY